MSTSTDHYKTLRITDRQVIDVMRTTNCTRDTAVRLLEKHNGSIKSAVRELDADSVKGPRTRTHKKVRKGMYFSEDAWHILQLCCVFKGRALRLEKSYEMVTILDEAALLLAKKLRQEGIIPKGFYLSDLDRKSSELEEADDKKTARLEKVKEVKA